MPRRFPTGPIRSNRFVVGDHRRCPGHALIVSADARSSACLRGSDGRPACRWCRSPPAGHQTGWDRRVCRLSRRWQAQPLAASPDACRIRRRIPAFQDRGVQIAWALLWYSCIRTSMLGEPPVIGIRGNGTAPSSSARPRPHSAARRSSTRLPVSWHPPLSCRPSFRRLRARFGNPFLAFLLRLGSGPEI
jgi:hypothetical protein